MILSFHNEYDDVDVTVSDEAPCDGPYKVCLVFNDPAITSPEQNETHSFSTIDAAMVMFLVLVKSETDSIVANYC